MKSNDFVALEDLQIGNMVKNRHLAKSISDAAWGEFRRWIEYFGKVYGVATVAVLAKRSRGSVNMDRLSIPEKRFPI